MPDWRIIQGDCMEALQGLADGSMDAIVTDPPYGLGFMGREWDALPPGLPWARECLRVLKPGGHLLAFGGTRTYHRLACAVEDAGFEIRDCVAWLYGSGFPKSHNLDGDWQGWGTALKPAFEPVVVARKPLTGTVAASVLERGTGALNIDGCRVGRAEGDRTDYGLEDGAPAGVGYHGLDGRTPYDGSAGRWPANVLLDEEAAALLDAQTAHLKEGFSVNHNRDGAAHSGNAILGARNADTRDVGYGDSGGASRFFYCAKASSAERNAGPDGFEAKPCGSMEDDGYDWSREAERGRQPRNTTRRNVHPTVKPIDVMRWLVRLVTPPGGTVLDTFTGSGTTGIAAVLEGFDFIGVEREPEYVAIAEARIAWWAKYDPGADTERALMSGRERDEIKAGGQWNLFDTEEVA